MAILKAKDISKMSEEEIKSKIKDLQFELVKAKTGANKASAKTKEIKRTIARLITFNRASVNKKRPKAKLKNKDQ